MLEEDSKSHEFSLSFVAGLVVGSVLLLSLGTEKGRKIISQIKSDGPGVWESHKNKGEITKTKVGALENIGRSAKRFFKKSGKSGKKL